MEARAVTKYLRISPRKVRLVIDQIRRKPVEEACYLLAALNKKAARVVLKSLESAMANAKVKKMDEKNLVIAEVKADGGPMLKRIMTRSMGRADRIKKRSTHLTITLKEKGHE